MAISLQNEHGEENADKINTTFAKKESGDDLEDPYRLKKWQSNVTLLSCVSSTRH
jgi:hypothetical protein